MSEEDKQKLLTAIAEDNFDLEIAPKKLLDDKEVILAAIDQDSWSIKYASERLRGDKEVALAAIAKDPRLLRCVSEDLRADKEVVKAALDENDGSVYYFIADELRNDEEIAMLAVKNMFYVYGQCMKIGDMVQRIHETLNCGTCLELSECGYYSD